MLRTLVDARVLIALAMPLASGRVRPARVPDRAVTTCSSR